MGPQAGRPSPPAGSLLPSAEGRVSSRDSENPAKAGLFTGAAYSGQGPCPRVPPRRAPDQGQCTIRHVHLIANVHRIRTQCADDPDILLHAGASESRRGRVRERSDGELNTAQKIYKMETVEKRSLKNEPGVWPAEERVLGVSTLCPPC